MMPKSSNTSTKTSSSTAPAASSDRSRYRGGGTLSRQALNELNSSLPVTETLGQAMGRHGISPLIQRTILQLQRTVAMQGKLLHDQSRAVTRMQHQMYVMQDQLNQLNQPSPNR